MSPELIDFVGKIRPESIVDIYGVIRPAQVKSATLNHLEMEGHQLFLVSPSVPSLPIHVEDCSRFQPLMDEHRDLAHNIESRLLTLQSQMETATGDIKSQLRTELAETQLQKAALAQSGFIELSQSVKLDNRVIDLRVR